MKKQELLKTLVQSGPLLVVAVTTIIGFVIYEETNATTPGSITGELFSLSFIVTVLLGMLLALVNISASLAGILEKMNEKQQGHGAGDRPAGVTKTI
jgi:uncharacterized membrane protein